MDLSMLTTSQTRMQMWIHNDTLFHGMLLRMQYSGDLDNFVVYCVLSNFCYIAHVEKTLNVLL
jgi:hypothetical protein